MPLSKEELERLLAIADEAVQTARRLRAQILRRREEWKRRQKQYDTEAERLTKKTEQD